MNAITDAATIPLDNASHPARVFVREFLDVANEVTPIDTIGALLMVSVSVTSTTIDAGTLGAAMAIEGELFWEGRQQ